MLYKNLPRNVGLKRLTLHKSATGPNVNYILLVECSHFLDNINQVIMQNSKLIWTMFFLLQAANLLPVLRARICGYTGIFRIVESFWPSAPGCRMTDPTQERTENPNLEPPQQSPRSEPSQVEPSSGIKKSESGGFFASLFKS